MVHSLDVLQGELQALALELQLMPPPSPTPDWWGTRLNRLFDLYTLVAAIHTHPHLDALHRGEAATALTHIWDCLVGTDQGYHRHCHPSSLPLAGADRGPYLVTHLCPGNRLRDAPSATFATLDAALVATGHHDPARWTAAGDRDDQLVIAVPHRRTWVPVSEWTIRGAGVAAALQERLTEKTAT